MEENTTPEGNQNTLCRCPYCACCFCTETDLKHHMDSYSSSKVEHSAKFNRVHGNLEHGSFGGSM